MTIKKSELVTQKFSNKHELHEFKKQNLFTLNDKKSPYDIFMCKNCGVSGRRYALDGKVIRDKEYKPKVYEYCDTTKVHLAKRKFSEG